MTERDPFAYDTGLPEGPGTFTNVRFTRDPAVNEGQTLLMKADLLFDDPDVGEYEARWSCGEKFESTDDGQTAERIDGRDKAFHMNSAVAKLGSAMLKSGAEDVMRERYADGGVTPRHAAMYEGLKFNFVNVPYSATINGDKVEWTTLEVDEYLGNANNGNGNGKAASTAKKPARAKKAVAPVAESGGVDPAVRQQVFDIAYAAEDEASYIETAMATFADQMTPELDAAISDVDEGSIWHEAVEKFNADNA